MWEAAPVAWQSYRLYGTMQSLIVGHHNWTKCTHINKTHEMLQLAPVAWQSYCLFGTLQSLTAGHHNWTKCTHTSLKHTICCPCSLTILLSVWHCAVTHCWPPQVNQMHIHIIKTQEMLLLEPDNPTVCMTLCIHFLLPTTTAPNVHTSIKQCV